MQQRRASPDGGLQPSQLGSTPFSGLGPAWSEAGSERPSTPQELDEDEGESEPWLVW